MPGAARLQASEAASAFHPVTCNHSDGLVRACLHGNGDCRTCPDLPVQAATGITPILQKHSRCNIFDSYKLFEKEKLEKSLKKAF